MTNKQDYLMKMIAYEMHIIQKKADLEDRGFTETPEYDAVCEDLHYLDKMIEHLRFVYDTATRRERDKELFEKSRRWHGEGEH